jgi:hypothetical protein
MKEWVRRMRVKKEKVVNASITAWFYIVFNTLPDYVGQKRFKYSDITSDSKICTAVNSSLNSSQKQVTTANYFSK